MLSCETMQPNTECKDVAEHFSRHFRSTFSNSFFLFLSNENSVLQNNTIATKEKNKIRSVTRCWKEKLSKTQLQQCFKVAQKAPYFWDSFVRLFTANIFQKQPNLVTLHKHEIQNHKRCRHPIPLFEQNPFEPELSANCPYNRDSFLCTKAFLQQNEVKAHICQTNLVIALYALSLLFCKFTNTTAYHLGIYKPSAPVSCRAP